MSKKNRKNKHNLAYADNTLNFENIRNKPPHIIPRSLAQEHYVDILTDINCSIAITSGPAGTGKTYLAMLASIRALRLGQVEKIVLTRPAVGVDDERHGFLPGDLNAKMEPWTRPLFDVLKEYYSPKEITRMLEEEIIEISPLAFMRGRTFKKSWIIADEMQNATPSQMKMLLTRLGEDSKIVVTGDVKQADRKDVNNGLLNLTSLTDEKEMTYIRTCQFTNKDIERHPAVAEVLTLYGES
ncbi:MAG: phosphate starvation-inducible protein PhoH [Euryarchaeota archaeon]|jgi:phosphate starvation-inducible PhoH-like protein|nr:phosphate starvation-inducible protein PhoH [Euryarchaeota archaeon]